MLTIDHPLAGSPAFVAIGDELVEVVRFLSGRGWTPATSSNFSALVPGYADAVAISRSGVDKASFCLDDVMLVDRAGRNLWPEAAKSSAETLIHTALYDLFDCGAVLHTHSVSATAVSLMASRAGSITFSGLELLKGLSGITTHEASVVVPIFPNDQDMVRFAAMLREELRDRTVYGFLIAGHGVYTWGHTLRDARRHLEVFEFLFELALHMERFNGHTHDS